MKEDFGAAAGEAALKELAATTTLLDQHYRWLDKTHSGKFNELGIEVRKRVKQLQLLLAKILTLLVEASDIHSRLSFPRDSVNNDGWERAHPEWQRRMEEEGNRHLMKRDLEILDEIELLTEAFYWFAARARTAIKLLPGLEGFEAKGVRDVRNKLLEHPEKKDSGILITSFAYGAPIGPVVRALRESKQESVWVDKGLFVNANEFSTKLAERISRSLSAA